jgi:hypothetical protein
MKYANVSRALLTVAFTPVRPGQLTPDLTPEQIKADPNFERYLKKGHLVEYKGGPIPPSKLDASKAKYDTEETQNTGKLVTSKRGVTYIMADAEGSDAVDLPGDEDVVAGKDKAGDLIDSGVDARTYKSAAQAIEDELNLEDADAAFDDEPTLSETEPERNMPEDADELIRGDISGIVTKGDKFGAEVKSVKEIVQTEVAKGMNKVAQEVGKSLDNNEVVKTSDPRVAEFLKQPLNAKKVTISKATDKAFLSDVAKITKSDPVKKLIDQRLQEIK